MDKIKKYGCLIIKIFFFMIFLLLILVIWATTQVEHDDIGNGYEYYPNGHYISGPLNIPDKIVCYTYDDNYIVATQKYWNGDTLPLYNTGKYTSARLASIDTDKDNLVYWIVNKKNHKNILCGSVREFIEECNSIGVPDSLILHIIH